MALPATRRRPDSPSWSSTTARATVLDAERAAAPWPPTQAAAAAVGRRAGGPPPELAAAVEDRLRELAMPHAVVGVEVDEATIAGEHVAVPAGGQPGLARRSR